MNSNIKIPYCHFCTRFRQVDNISFVCSRFGLKRNLANGKQTELKHGCWEEKKKKLEKWYQKWWGRVIIGLIVGLILLLIGLLV